jgi:ABC-type multidrug transport system fused ATPase/permease subunit
MNIPFPALLKRRQQGTKKEEKRQGGAAGAIRMLARFMFGQRRLFFIAGVMLVFEAFTAVQVPLLIKFVLDYMEKRVEQLRGIAVSPPPSALESVGLPSLFGPDVDAVVLVTLGFIVLTMVNSLADSLSEIYLARGGRRLGYNLRVGLYTHLQKLSLAFHDQRRTGDVLTRITGDVAALEDFIISSLSDFVGSVLLIVLF